MPKADFIQKCPPAKYFPVLVPEKMFITRRQPKCFAGSVIRILIGRKYSRLQWEIRSLREERFSAKQHPAHGEFK
jgi:hypothetical protein